ncbi:MAG: NAD(P)-binding protein [Planctomycetes bacterium]|nr:NAD(P)-binding protein [Planctomycetota bacterium]MBI3457039.1 NAD(P)-binding protein [Candidatus Rokubacteria bacterium]
MKRAVVVGAGFAGCAYAMPLRERGWSVTVIEKAGFIGGGVRTFFHGGHPYTYGPRHFLSPYPEAFDFLNKFVPLRHIKKINYTYLERDQAFYTYPIHEDDIAAMPDADIVWAELAARPEEAKAANFEEFWIQRVGSTLYGKYVRDYNRKAWMLKSNAEMDFGFESTVKRRPLESGERYEFKDWFNCYPIPQDGYNQFFDIALEGCDVRLDTTITAFDVHRSRVDIGSETLTYDLLVSTISPDVLLNYQYGELKYVGREFHKIVLPIEFALPQDVYFVYYPNASETHTRVVEYKKFTLHKSPSTLLGLEIPSLKNKLYPTLIKAEVEKAQRYLDALPGNVRSVGRMGVYRYIDIDDIIMQSLQFAKEL